MRILLWVWRFLMGVKNVLVLLFMLLFFGVLYALLSARPNAAAPMDGALLVELAGSVVEQPSRGDGPSSLLAGNPGSLARQTRLRDLVTALNGAAGDSAIKTVALDLDGFIGAEPAALNEIGIALDHVRRAGKPVFAFATAYTDDSYRLAAHASEVWLDPMGGVFLSGPGGQRLYYKGLLDKLGVDAQVFRVGAFKSAVEPYTRTGQSPEAKEAAQALDDTLWTIWQDDVRRARPTAGLAPYLQAITTLTAPPASDLASIARQYRMVDTLGDRTAWARKIAAVAGDAPNGRPDQFRAVRLVDWVAAHPSSNPSGEIAVVTIAGPIVDGDAGPGTAGGGTIAGLLRDPAALDGVKALVVRVDSPGGSVLASEQIRRAIADVAAEKKLPVVVSMGGMAASGGYWVSTTGAEIIADPATITGSIGVFGIVPTFKGAMGKLGVATDGVRTTPLSGEPDLYNGPSPAMAAIMQGGVNDIYRRFTGLVAAARKLPVTRVDEIGQGRVWAGATAHQLRLVDRFGAFGDALAAAAKRANIDPATAGVRFLEPKMAWYEALMMGLSSRYAGIWNEAAAQDPWTVATRQQQRQLIRGAADLDQLLAGPTMQVACLECIGFVPADRLPRKPLETISFLLNRKP